MFNWLFGKSKRKKKVNIEKPMYYTVKLTKEGVDVFTKWLDKKVIAERKIIAERKRNENN